MATLKDFRDERLRKLDELKKLGVNPYPADSKRTHTLGEINKSFEKLEGKPATVVGRILNIRKMGKIAFVVLKDGSGQLQLFLKDGSVGKPDFKKSELGFEHLNLLDS